MHEAGDQSRCTVISENRERTTEAINPVPAVDRDGNAGATERIVRELVIDRPRVAIVAYCSPGAPIARATA